MDFGATREIPDNLSRGYFDLFSALLNENNKQIIDAARNIGFFKQDIDQLYLDQIIRLFNIAAKPLKFTGEYDFANCTVAEQITQSAGTINRRKDQWHTPPVDALFIHRKIAGLYLIAKKLNAKVNINSLFCQYN